MATITTIQGTDLIKDSRDTINTNLTNLNNDKLDKLTETTDNLTEGTTNKFASTVNVDSAGATMNTDTDISGNSWILDEDDMNSNSNTKLPTQQSVKNYVDNSIDNNINGLTEDTSPDIENDFNIVYDTSGSVNKKYKMSVYRATDSEATAGTIENKFINPKQAKDNYSTKIIPSYSLVNTSGAFVQIDGNSDTYAKKKQADLTGVDGTIRVSFNLKSSGNAWTAYGRIYINGNAVGVERTNGTESYVVFEEDFNVSSGDLVQLYMKGTGTRYAENNEFKIMYSIVPDSVTNPSITTH